MVTMPQIMLQKNKKGFIQLVEVAIAAFLIIFTLPIFFSGLNVKLGWERADLLATGNNILRNLQVSGEIYKILNKTEEVEKNITLLKPINVGFGLKVSGSPKPNITVGCNCTSDRFDYVKSLLTPVYVNGRWVNFATEKISFPTPEKYNYDVILFSETVDFDNDAEIQNFLRNGGKVVIFDDIEASEWRNLRNTLNINENPGGSADYMNFRDYNPSKEIIPRYFLGFGFDIATTAEVEGKGQGYWYIWCQQKQVNNTGSAAEIQDVGSKSEGDVFSLSGPDMKSYFFKIKKIWPDKYRVDIQPLNTSFVFKDFRDAGEAKLEGVNNVIYGNKLNTYSLMIRNGSAVWLSNFSSYSDEYKTLLKSAVASLANEFYLFPIKTKGKHVVVPYFLNLCCDMPETLELGLVLWYMY